MNQHPGPMAGHVRKGRVFKPPLVATGVFTIGNWVKDDLPDLLWPALAAAEQGDSVLRKFIWWQRDVQEALTHHDAIEFVAEQLDGRQTSLVRLVDRLPDAADIVVTCAHRHGLLSTPVQRILALYPFRPAPWLTGDLTVDGPSQDDLDLLADALLSVMKSGHREALIKCLRTWSTVQAGTFRADLQMIELLKDYPTNTGKRAAADTTIRAQWGAHRALLASEDPDFYSDTTKCARVFWGMNSMTTMCVRKREITSENDMTAEPVDADPLNEGIAATDSDETAPATIPEDGAHLRRLTMDLMSSFVEALETAPARLYENERQEVVSGLVSRAGRELVAVLSAPDLWCLEHGAHVGRMLVEVKIYLRWMAQQDPSIYRQFQAYGAGKAKLYARIVDELPAEARTPGFNESIDELNRLSHNDEIIDHRTVDTSDTFADGKSIRAMAAEAGLLDLYRQAYSLSSGVTHSEWWSVENHAMEPCLNVLHGGHQIPSLTLNPGGNVELASSWVQQFHSLVLDAFQILETDDEAVKSAFEWLDSPPEDSPELSIA